MSLQQPQKLTEAKAKSKFQSLNINNIYQVILINKIKYLVIIIKEVSKEE